MGKEAVGYRQLIVWKKSMELVKLIYQSTRSLPDTERYGLVSQAQRAVVSIPANIAEGYGCGGGDYPRHVRIARGSLMELEVYLELFVTLDFIPRAKIVPTWKLSQEVGAMLASLLQSLDYSRKSPTSRPKPKP
jgi:four helix bundle protein